MPAELMSKDTKFTMHSRKDSWTSSITGMVTMTTVGKLRLLVQGSLLFLICTYFTRWSTDFEEFV